jgi:hypothetical protein
MRFVPLFVGLLMLASCNSRLEAVAPTIKVQEPEFPKQRESTLSLPIKINLQQYFDQTEQALPKSFTGKEENCEGVSYTYKFFRNPISFNGKGEHLNFEVDGKYSLNLNYCPNCSELFDSKGTCIVPRVYVSCGVNEPLRRVSVGYSTKFSLTPDFKFKTTTELRKFETIDPCEFTVFKYDATNRLKKEVTGVLKELEKTIDKQIASVDIRSQIKEIWKKLSEPVALEGYGYLTMQPKAVSLSDIRFENKLAYIDLNLTLAPLFTTEKPLIEEEKLPNLSAYKEGKGFDIELEAVASYDSLSSILTEAVQGKSITIKKNIVNFKKLEVHGAFGNQLQLKLEFDGKKKGVLYLQGTPTFDKEKQTITFPDITFDLESKNLLLNSAKWLFNDKITNVLREQASFDMKPHLEDAKKRLYPELNKELSKGVFLRGETKTLDINSINPSVNALILRINLKGDLKLSM